MFSGFEQALRPQDVSAKRHERHFVASSYATGKESGQGGRKRAGGAGSTARQGFEHLDEQRQLRASK